MKKTILAAAMIIGGGTLLFQGFTQAAIQSQINKTTTVPTSYAKVTTSAPQAIQKSLPEGYKKANYSVKNNPLEYYRDKTPTSKDMSKEAAAEIGAQALWETYGLNLEGLVVQMGYDEPTESLPRSRWGGEVLINGKITYYFSVDSVTGELFGVGFAKSLDKKVSLDFDSALHKNPKEYVELAKKVAEKHDVVHGPIKSVEYNNQGYSNNNNPDITMYVTGENGEIATITFSRYDKELLSIGYHAQYAIESAEKAMKDLIEKVKHLEKTDPSFNDKKGLLIEVK
jgi:archaellin